MPDYSKNGSAGNYLRMHYHRLGLAEYFKLEHSGKARAGGRGRKVGKYRQCGGKGGDMLKGFWADIAKQQRASAPNRAAVFGFVHQRGNCYPEICKRKENPIHHLLCAACDWHDCHDVYPFLDTISYKDLPKVYLDILCDTICAAAIC